MWQLIVFTKCTLSLHLCHIAQPFGLQASVSLDDLPFICWNFPLFIQCLQTSACSAKIQRSYLWFKWFCCERNYLKSEAVTPQPQSDFSASPDQLLASLPARAGGTLNRSSSGRTAVKARKYHMFSDPSLINQLMINFPVSARRRQSCGVHLRWDERRYRGSLGTKNVVTG